MTRGAIITVSANEVLRTTEWILRGRGVQCGNEDAPARAAAWLALGYPPALSGLVIELATPGAIAPLEALNPRFAERRLEIDAAGASALLVCPLALDWLRACGWPGDAMVTIRNLASPLWCLGHLALLDAGPALGLSAAAGDGETGLSLCRSADGSVEAALMAPIAAIWGRVYELATLTVNAGPAGARATERLTAGQLADTARSAMASGLRVEASLWRELSCHAYQAYVPESATSRDRGAGGGDDNE